MIKLDIQERDGFLIMDDFPKNCIFNKVKTGCGATTIALTNDENYIIAVPTTELVIATHLRIKTAGTLLGRSHKSKQA